MDPKADTFLSVSSNPSSSSSPTYNNFDLNIVISPTVLLSITLLSFIIFISALLHLLVRFLLSHRTRLDDTDEESVIALQGRLFNPNSGVGQSFIHALPLYHYKTMIGIGHDPFDCVVCLSEFNAEDDLRLLPKCCHAFHMNCIDTWLLKNSTCPLCRDDLTASSSHVILGLESDGESFRDSDSQLGLIHFDDNGSKSCDISGHNDESKPENNERVVLVSVSGEAERLQ